MMSRRLYSIPMSIITRVSPRLTSHLLYLRGMRRRLNLRNPVLFSEKLMKLKLDNYIKNPLVWQCVDKLSIREYAREKGITEESLPVILGIYTDARDIDFGILPEKFALKCTHGAGFNIICHDKKHLDKRNVIKKLNKWLITPFGIETAEIQYGKVQPRIICEAFIESGSKASLPNDYKIYCFSGMPMYIMACTERDNGVSKVNIMDISWTDTGYIKPTYALDRSISKPATLTSMLEMAGKVSSVFPFVRVDFYEDKGVPILGEMTFTPHACVNSNMTMEGQMKFGALLDLDYQSKGDE